MQYTRLHGACFLFGALLVVALTSAIAGPIQEAPTKTSRPTSKRAITTPEDVFASMRRSFRADRSRGLHLRYQIGLTSANGGHWYVTVDAAHYTIAHGTIPSPDVTITTSAADWVKLYRHDLNGPLAYLTGRLKISGDQSIARKLDEIFP